MSMEEKAAQYHAKGFNCAQSVLAACGEYTGLDEKTALANVIKRLHGGGIYLFHAESDANTNFLAKLIDAIRSKNMETGYYARMD